MTRYVLGAVLLGLGAYVVRKGYQALRQRHGVSRDWLKDQALSETKVGVDLPRWRLPKERQPLPTKVQQRLYQVKRKAS